MKKAQFQSSTAEVRLSPEESRKQCQDLLKAMFAIQKAQGEHKEQHLTAA